MGNNVYVSTPARNVRDMIAKLFCSVAINKINNLFRLQSYNLIILKKEAASLVALISSNPTYYKLCHFITASKVPVCSKFILCPRFIFTWL